MLENGKKRRVCCESCVDRNTSWATTLVEMDRKSGLFSRTHWACVQIGANVDDFLREMQRYVCMEANARICVCVYEARETLELPSRRCPGIHLFDMTMGLMRIQFSYGSYYFLWFYLFHYLKPIFEFRVQSK